MNFESINFVPALPEITLSCLLAVVLLLDLFLCEKRRWMTYALTQLGLLSLVVLQFWVMEQPEAAMPAFNNMFVNDSIAILSKVIMYVSTMLLLAYSRHYLVDRGLAIGEYYTLTLFALLGMSVMVSAQHFLLLYIGLELLSLALYAMIALRRDAVNAGEAALKYFVLGSLASGMLLYGISLIYGGTAGQLDLTAVLGAVYQGAANPVLVRLGLVFVVVGVAFKFGAVPFHMWVPDVYQGAPLSVVAFVASVPKIAATVFAFRILVAGLGLNFADWALMLQILAVASLLIGNLAAIMQTNIKRMLAYSTISHMGFVLLAFTGNAFLAMQPDANSFSGMSAAIYYATTYVLMSLVAFGVLIALSGSGKECENISDLAGLNRTHPWYAFLMLLAMFSMAGIPPLMGFFAKFYVIMALLNQSLIGLAVFAVVMSLIGAFYYLRVVKTMYFDEPSETSISTSICPMAKVFLSCNAMALLILGMFPSVVLDWCVALFTRI